MTAAEILQLMTLINALAPTGIELVKTLTTKLQGKSDEELKAFGDALDDAIIARADSEIAALPTDVKEN